MRFILWFLRFKVSWICVLLLAGLGVVYIQACLTVLMAPGARLKATIPTENGNLTLTADSYTIDPWNGAVAARNVAIFSPLGQPIGNADLVSIRSNRLNDWPNSGLILHLAGLKTTIERDRNGLFALQRYFESKEPPKKGAALEVHVRDSQILWIDAYRGPTYRRTIQINRLRFDQTASIWRSRFDLGSGSEQVSGFAESKETGGVQGQVELTVGQGGPLWKRYREVLMGSQLSAGDAPQLDNFTYRGKVQFHVGGQEGPITVAAQGRLTSTGLLIQPWRDALQGEFEGHLLETTIDPRHPDQAEYFVRGELALRSGENSGRIDGDFKIGPKPQVAGNIQLGLAGLEALPNEWKQGLDPKLKARGLRFSGSLGWQDGQAVRLGGQAQIASMAFGDESAAGLTGQFQMVENDITARVDQLRWRGQLARGGLNLNVQSGSLKGHVQADRVQLERVIQPYADLPVTGQGSITAEFSGRSDDLRVAVRSDGRCRYLLKDRPLDFDRYELSGVLDKEVFLFERGVLLDPAGRITVSGKVNTKTQAVELEFQGQDLRLAELDKRVGGRGSAKIAVRGTSSKPEIRGRVEVLDARIEGQSIPIVVGNITVQGDRVNLTDVVATRGASQVTGQVSMDTRTNALDGTFDSQQIQIADWVNEGVIGSVAIDSGKVGGTLDEPEVFAKGSGKQWVVNSLLVEAVAFAVRWKGDVVAIEDVSMSLGDGQLVGRGTYAIANQDLTLSGSATEVSLDQLLPVLPGDTLVRGQVGGEFSLSAQKGEVSEAKLAGRIAELAVNKTQFGSGPAQVQVVRGVWTGSATVGSPERFIEMSNVRYNESDKSIVATLTSLSTPVNDLVRVVLPNLTTDPAQVKSGVALVTEDVFAKLQQLDGLLDSSIQVSGTLDALAIEAQSVEIRNVTVQDQPSGVLRAKGNRSGSGLWTIESLQWLDGPGIAQVQGTFDEHGEVAISGVVQSFQPRWLQVFEPSFSKTQGSANLNFEVSGPHDSPEIVASLDANLFPIEGDAGAGTASSQLNFVVGPIRVVDGEATFEGSFTAQGITGRLDGKLPFRYPFELPNDQPVEIVVSIPERGLDELQSFLPKLDLEPLKGSFRGQLRIIGTYDALKLDGDAQLNVERLASPELGTAVDNLSLRGVFTGDTLQFSASGQIGEKGSVSSNTSVRIPDLLRDFDGNFSRFLDSRISGRMSLNEVMLQEPIGKDGSGFFRGTTDGEVLVGGTVRQPIFSTFFPLLIKDFALQMPGEFDETSATAKPTFSPRFNIGIVIAEPKNPARIKAAAADIRLSGAGKLTGELAAPELSSSLNVEDGVIRLPNARIVLDEGGRVRVLYSADDLGTPLRVDVDLEGRTAISAAIVTPNVQRYSIDLRIRGNLLDENSVVLTARSDPPDLTQAQILNLLGQESLVQTLANQFLGQRDNKELASALAGAALPYLLDPFTSQLAKEFGLDYITLEYNGFEGATITAARTLGGGFSLQGRRQIAERPGQSLLYDYRLTWRSKRGGRALRNVTFSLGTDQDRPYKITVEYGIRF